MGAPIDRQTFVRDSLSRSLQNKPGTASYRPPSQLRTGASASAAGTSLDDTADYDLEPSDDDYLTTTSKLQTLQETFNDLSVSYRFFGKSSGANLVQTALDLKSEYSGTEQDYMRLRMAKRRPEFWTQHTVRVLTPLRLSCARPLPWLIVSPVGADRLPPRPTPVHLSRAGPDRPPRRPLFLAHQLVPSTLAPPDVRTAVARQPALPRPGVWQRPAVPVRVRVALLERFPRAHRYQHRMALVRLEMVRAGAGTATEPHGPPSTV